MSGVGCIHHALFVGVQRLFPFIVRVFADGGYQGAATAAAVWELGAWHLEIAKCSGPKGTRSGHTAKGFQVLPERWIVERTFGWLDSFATVTPA